MKLENAFTMDTSSIKFGPGATREIGFDMQEQGCRRIMVVTDPNLADSSPVAVALEALRSRGLEAVLFDRSSVEPTDVSFKEAITFAVEGKFDGYLAIGGGSRVERSVLLGSVHVAPDDAVIARFLAQATPTV